MNLPPVTRVSHLNVSERASFNILTRPWCLWSFGVFHKVFIEASTLVTPYIPYQHHVWGSSWFRQVVLFRCDNESVVYILNSCTSTAPDVKHLRCSLLMTAARHNFIFTAGSSNKIPDALSHFNWQAFHRLALHADHHPRVILPHLWEELTYQAWNRTALP